MKKCKHKNVHTELTKGSFGMVVGSFLFDEYSSYEVPAINSRITTYCADCGQKLKTVELNDYSPKE